MKSETRPLCCGFRIAIASVLLAGAARASEINWPQFRGPRSDGISLATNVPLRWNQTQNVAWNVRLPGKAESSPVVLGKRLWLTTALPQGVRRTRIDNDDMQTAEHVSLEALCLDATNGAVLWRQQLFDIDRPAPVHWLNSWATPTPIVTPGRLYCDFGAFGTACLDADTGKILWRSALLTEHKVGPGSSPVLYQDLLILVRDGCDIQYLAALDAQTGQLVWRTNRPPIIARFRDYKKAFSTPLIISDKSQTQLIAPGAQWIASYDPATGREIWRARHGEGFSLSSSPVFGRGLVFFSTGMYHPQLCAMRTDGREDVTRTQVAWRTARQAPAMSSPLLVDTELYWVSDSGVACCADAQTGQLFWQERLGGTFMASPLFAEGRIYFFNRAGQTFVIKPGKQFQLLSQNQIAAPLVATPAVVDGALFLRTDSNLFRIGANK